MLLTVELTDIETDEAMLHTDDASVIGIRSQERIALTSKNSEKLQVIRTAVSKIAGTKGIIYLSRATGKKYNLKAAEVIEVKRAPIPKSVPAIRKKIEGSELTAEEIAAVVHESTTGILSGGEISAYLTAVEIRGMTMEETEALTREMVASGDTIEFDDKPIVDHHSIGGVPGNKVTLLVVPILAAAGLKVPKTCSRAITGAGGTADLMEAVANVTFSTKEIQEMTEKAGAVIVWGGGANFAPADDVFIVYERPLKIDSRSQMIASILAKKKAAGADICIMDIPVGPGTKIRDETAGRELAKEFAELGSRLGMKIESAITYGGAPIGRTIGVNLEVAEALRTMEQGITTGSLAEKSLILAGMGLEMAGKAAEGDGIRMAKELLQNGKALEKMKDIIEVQGGNRNVTSADLKPGKFSWDFVSPSDGIVLTVMNRVFVDIARAAGSPADHGAGIYFHKKPGQHVEKGEKLYTIYADNETKLKDAVAIAEEHMTMTVGSMLLGRA